jgi:hypothetical protein
MYINADSSNSSASGLIAFGFNRTGFSGGAETMRLLENGTVGIGTITPATKLDVRGYITSDVNSDAVEGGFYLGNSGHGLRRPGGASNDVYLYTTLGNVFIGAAGSTSQQITVLTGGNVGIGTTSPLTRFHVNNTVGTGLTLSNTVASLYAEMRFQSANSSAYIFKNSTGYTSYGGADALNIFNEGQIALHSSTVSNIMYLTAVGNVGIGITTPTAPLDTNGVRIGRNFSIANRATVRLDSNTADYPADVLFGHTAAANQTGWDGVYWSVSSRGSSEGNKFYIYRAGGNPGGSGEEVILALQPNGNIGISTTSPTQKLQVAGAIAATLSNVNQANAVMYNSGTGLFTYVGTGSIVIGTATNADNIFVSEDATNANQPVLFAANTEAYYRARGDKSEFFYNPATNELTAGTYIETSALKFKENIVHLTGSLQQVEKFQGVSYNRIGQDHREIGLIADEVVKILPELVKYQDGQVYGLSYNRITAVLVEAVKELSDKVKQQEIFIQDLADRLKKQEDKG